MTLQEQLKYQNDGMVQLRVGVQGTDWQYRGNAKFKPYTVLAMNDLYCDLYSRAHYPISIPTSAPPRFGEKVYPQLSETQKK